MRTISWYWSCVSLYLLLPADVNSDAAQHTKADGHLQERLAFLCSHLEHWCLWLMESWDECSLGQSSFYQLDKSHAAWKAFMTKWPLCSVICDAQCPLSDYGKKWDSSPLKKKKNESWVECQCFEIVWEKETEREGERMQERDGERRRERESGRERACICGKEIVHSCVICHWTHGPELFPHFRAATRRSAGSFFFSEELLGDRFTLPPPPQRGPASLVLHLHLFSLCTEPLTIPNALPARLSLCCFAAGERPC